MRVFCIVANATAAVLILLAFWTWLGLATYSSELMARGLLANHALDIERTNQMLRARGHDIVLTGEIDAIGNPKDDWAALGAAIGNIQHEGWVLAIVALSLFAMLCNTTIAIIDIATNPGERNRPAAPTHPPPVIQ